MYYLIIALLLFTLPIHTEQYSEVEGVWSGAIEIYGEELVIHITFSYSEGELDGTLDIPQQQAFNLPVEVVRSEGEEITFQFETGTGPAIFYGVWDATSRSITGEFEQIGQRFPFYLNKQSRSGLASNDQTELDLIIPSRAGVIGGTLLLQDNPAPLIILLTGSGSQDRDETVAGFRVFNLLSKELYRNGFSSFRYDDRGIGASTGSVDASLDELAEDLIDIVNFLRSEHGDQFTELIFLGHSQGGLVASIAASEAGPGGLIFMATPFLSVDEIINQQIIKISEAQEVPEDVVNMNLEFQKRVYEVVRTGASWGELEESLRERLTEQINQLPDAQREALGDMSGFIQSQIDRQLSAAKSDWFKSLIELQPIEVLKELNVPILALFGEKDMQVFPDSNIRELINLKNQYNNEVEYRVIPDANHLFQIAITGMPSEYGLLDKSFAHEFIATIVEWISGLNFLTHSSNR